MAAREEMVKEAVKRMEILGIEKSFIKLFSENDGIRMTLQILAALDDETQGNDKVIEDVLDSSVSFGGAKYYITPLFPSEERFEFIKKLEDYNNCVVYYGCRIGLTQNGDEDIYAYFYVGDNEEEWEDERKDAEEGLAYAHTSVSFFPSDYFKQYEIMELTTVSCLDGLLAVWM